MLSSSGYRYSEIRTKFQIAVLKGIALTGRVAKACKMVELQKNTFYSWCEQYPEFKQLVDKAFDVYLDSKLNQLSEVERLKQIEEITSQLEKTP